MMPGERPLRDMIRPFDAHFANPNTTEVVVNECGAFGVETGGQWSWHEAPELTFNMLDKIGIAAAGLYGNDVDDAHPLSAGVLPDGQRVQICRPAATKKGVISLTMRRPSSRERSVDDEGFSALFEGANLPPVRHSHTDARLERLKADGAWPEFWREAVQARKTICVTGATHSGKTTLLKTLMCEVPLHERIVTIEDADEAGIMRQRNRVSLFHSSGGQSLAKLSADDLVKAALRMRPNRILMQEIRDADAFAFLRLLACGHPGSVTTWHAEEGDAFDALELMVRQHPAGNTIPDAKVRKFLSKHIDIIVWCTAQGNVYRAPNVWLKSEQAE